MQTYTCPMHPEIKQNKQGSCPKCGMRLVLRGVSSSHQKGHSDYTPLFVIIGLIFLTTLILAFRDSQAGFFSLRSTISYFMTGFFLTFAGFKLIDLKGFAEGYHTYDLLAQRWFDYGYIYPFLELFFGLAMIVAPQATWLLWTEFIVMAFSGIGVVTKLLKGEKFQCVCLGTFLKVSLTNITLVEDFGMAALALLMLFL